jgi:hypothetical protein
MPVRYLSDPEPARLSSWPDEIAVEDAGTYFTLSSDPLIATSAPVGQRRRIRATGSSLASPDNR